MISVLVDLDGTLSDASHRLHFIKPQNGEKKNWRAFFLGIPNDPVNWYVKNMVNLLWEKDYCIILITGRPENTREDTEVWLEDNEIWYDRLLMRPNNDCRPDYEVKRDLFLNLNIPIFDVFCAFEDRLQVVKMWKELGIPVFVCGNDYEDLYGEPK